MPMSAVAQARKRACFDGSEQGAHFLAVQHRRAAFGYDVLRPTHRVRGIHVDDLADDEPVKEHTYSGQVLLYRRFAKPSRRLSI
jgi:hypothetical protein